MSVATQQSQQFDDEELMGFAGPMLVNKLQASPRRKTTRQVRLMTRLCIFTPRVGSRNNSSGLQEACRCWAPYRRIRCLYS